MNPSPFAELARRRLRVVLPLAALMIGLYFGFMGLFAFDKPLLGEVLAPGLTLCLVLGPALMLAACLVSLAYALWANLCFDPAAERVCAENTRGHHGE